MDPPTTRWAAFERLRSGHTGHPYARTHAAAPMQGSDVAPTVTHQKEAPGSPPVRPQKERWLPLAEAARELHISIDTARRHLRKGALQGEQRATPQGFTWWVRS